MAYARDTFTASAAQTDFTMTFPYLDTADVLVYVDSVLQTEGASNDYTIVSTSIVRFNSGMVGGETVLILRSTSRNTRLVDYTTASTLTEEDMDNDSLQAFYMAQEAIDTAEASGIVTDLSDQWDFLNKQSVNVPIPTVNTGVASKAYVDSKTSVAGNVPTPANPGDDNKVLKASGGTFTWDTFYGHLASWVQNFLQDTTVAAARTELGLGTLAVQNTIDGTDIAMGSDAQGDVLYHNGTNYARLAAGTSGQLLQTQGAGANPVWASSAFTSQLLSVGHEQAQGVDGGTYTVGASWDNAPITTEYYKEFTDGGMIWEIAYDNQTGNFNVGNTLTGATSGATATIVGDTDLGTTGTLEVIQISGTFQNNEVISDGGGGSADSNIPSGVASGNAIWLPEGDFISEAVQHTWGIGLAHIRLRDVTNSSTLLRGVTVSDLGYAASSDNRHIKGKFSVPAGGAKVELQVRGQYTRTGNGFGDAANLSGETEKFMHWDTWKVG